MKNYLTVSSQTKLLLIKVAKLRPFIANPVTCIQYIRTYMYYLQNMQSIMFGDACTTNLNLSEIYR